MILTIDIGNSTTKFGVFDDEILVERLTIPTDREKTGDQIKQSILNSLSQNFHSVVISTVVPELNESFRKLSEKYFNCTPFFVTNEFNFGFKINYNPPANIGIDRLIAAFAASEKYGKPCIVCDFGTATTIDFISLKNEYLGGIIAPGLHLLADSLHQKTSKLPKVEIKRPEKVIGDSTISAIQSGIYFGYIGLVEGIIQRMIVESEENPKIIATGGFANLIAEGTQIFDFLDDSLMLEGLRLISKKLTDNHL